MPNLALVGVGKWGINWARTLAKLPRTQFRYCCDLSEGRLQTIKDQFPSVTTTTNFQELLNDKTLDGMVLATTAPTQTASTTTVSSLRRRSWRPIGAAGTDAAGRCPNG